MHKSTVLLLVNLIKKWILKKQEKKERRTAILTILFFTQSFVHARKNTAILGYTYSMYTIAR